MIYLLGGPPRVGKTIISNEIRKHCAIAVVSTDTLGAALEKKTRPEEAPDLFVFDRFNRLSIAERTKLMTDNPALLIDYVSRESSVVWGAVEELVRRKTGEDRDILIEGVAILPELMSRLEDVPHRVVFVGSQGAELAGSMKRYAAENAHDWMHHASDEYIDAFANCVNRMSAWIEREAMKHGFAYIEIADQRFANLAEVLSRALGLAD